MLEDSSNAVVSKDVLTMDSRFNRYLSIELDKSFKERHIVATFCGRFYVDMRPVN